MAVDGVNGYGGPRVPDASAVPMPSRSSRPPVQHFSIDGDGETLSLYDIDRCGLFYDGWEGVIVELNTSGAFEAVPGVFDDFVSTTLVDER